MYGHIVVYFTTILFLQLSRSVDCTLQAHHNIFCQPLPQVVAVNGQGLPYFVELHRCQGSIERFRPDQKKCTFATYDDVKVKTTTTHGTKEVILKNHTSCKEECATTCPSDLSERDSNTCACLCKLNKPPKGRECKQNFIWDSDHCNCKCGLKEKDTPSNKKFNKDKCEFVCNPCPQGRELEPSTCRCLRPRQGPAAVANGGDSDNSQQGKVLAALVIGEFVFLYLIFDFLLYSKKTGLMYYVRCKCRNEPNNEPQAGAAQAEGQPLANDGERANNVPLGVIVDRNGHNQLAPESRQLVSST